jgi:hypothetical protein
VNYAHICEGDPIPYDDVAIQQARRDVLGWWIPLLGSAFVSFTTIALDESHCGGAITVARDPRWFGSDPFARLFPGRVEEVPDAEPTLPPPGPVIERYAGAPWPTGRYQSKATP